MSMTDSPLTPYGEISRNMLAQLQQLRIRRSELDTARRHYDAMYRSFLESAKDIIKEQNNLKMDVEVLEASIRLDAVKAYEMSGVKDLEGGVRIRIMHDIDITDMNAALEWGIEHKIALVPDVKRLKELSKFHEMPFIQVTERAQATIPKDIVILEGESR